MIEIARQASESGLTVSSGRRIENAPPWTVEASMLVVMSWPWRMVTAGSRPTTSRGSVKMPLTFVSSRGTERTATSRAVIGRSRRDRPDRDHDRDPG